MTERIKGPHTPSLRGAFRDEAIQGHTGSLSSALDYFAGARNDEREIDACFQDMFQHSRAANRVRVLIALTLGKSKRAQGMPGDGLTHGPPAAKKAGGSHHR
jgi:hypothetical protein